MSKYKEIMRLLCTTSLSERIIAHQLHVGRDTVSATRETSRKLGVLWEEVKTKEESEIRNLLFPKEDTESIQVMPDFEQMVKEYDKPGVTRKLLWEEYVEAAQAADGIPYQYSQFCELFSRTETIYKTSMHKNHTPAERIEVDWAGTKVPVTDPDTGEVSYGYMFVSVLPYSQYAYAEILPDMKLENWISAHVNMYEFYRGVTPVLYCDNLKTGILEHPLMGDWVENQSYREMADYYDTAIVAAPILTPRAKASVEGTVGKLTTQIIARMRNKHPESIWKANEYCKEYLTKFNAGKFEKRDGSRLEEYLSAEKPALHPLPKEPYEFGVWKTATVQLNYHISIDRMNYSVPYRYVHQKVNVRISKYKIDIYLNQERIASHQRLYGHPGQYSTNYDHMPENHKQASGWNGDRFRKWARTIGESVYIVIDRLLKSYKAEEQGYNACMSILKFADAYTPERLEKTCAKALSVIHTPRYKDIKLIIEHYQADTDQDSSDSNRISSTDQQDCQDNKYAVLRGSDYYGGRK